MDRKDYIYCESDGSFVDLWKYDSLEDAGHKNCNWRFVTTKELKNLVKDCKEFGCFEEYPELIKRRKNHAKLGKKRT